MTFEDKAEVVISQLRTDRDRLLKAIDDIKAEIGNNVEWHFKNHQEDIAQIYSDALNIIDRHIGDKEC